MRILLGLILWGALLLPTKGVAIETAKKEITFQNVSIVVSSCDKYEECWKPFFALLYKSWPSLKTINAHVPIYLITGQKEHSDPRITVVKTDPKKSWSTALLKTLEKVTTDYVIYIQEDYFLVLDVNEQRLSDLFDFFKKEDGAYLAMGPHYLFDSIPHPGLTGVACKSKNHRRRIDLQTALWNKKDLISLLDPKEDPWEFEVSVNSKKHKNFNRPVFVVFNNMPFCYLNGCILGYWVEQVLDYLQSVNVMGTPSLPIREQEPYAFWIRQKIPFLYKPFMWIKRSIGS